MSTKDCSSVYHKLIRKNYVELTEGLELRDTMVIERLYSKGVINKREKQVLQACTHSFERAEKLLDIFENRSQAHIEELIKTLIETRQDHIVKSYLTPTGSSCKIWSESQQDKRGGTVNGHDRFSTEWPARSPMYDPEDFTGSTSGEDTDCDIPHAQSISIALDGQRQQWYTIAGKVTKKSEVECYQGNTGVSIFFFTVTMCDPTGIADILVYHMSKYSLIKPGKCYIFENVVRRAEIFVTTDQSNICRIPSMSIPEEVETNTKRELSCVRKENTSRSLKMALEALNSSHIRGKILKISPLKYVKDGELPVRHLALIDTPGMSPVKMSVFADDANKDFNVGQCLDITHVYTKKSDASEMSLGTTTESLITVITDFSEYPVLKNLKSAVPIEDPDFDVQNIVDMKIYAIDSAAVYACCIRRGCYNKKLNEDGLCPVCGGSSSRGRSCWVKVKVEHDDRSTCHSLVKSDLDKFLQLKDLGCYSDDEALIDDVCDQLPVYGKACFDGDSMSIITVKRKGEQNE